MPDKEAVYTSAKRYGGKVHGDDANGLADVEFPDIARGSAWASGWAVITDVKLREPVTDLTSPVVIQIQL
jgi:hypothetical protein